MNSVRVDDWTADFSFIFSNLKLIFFKYNRNYLESGWCKEEFSLGHLEAIEGRQRFIILIMLDDLQSKDLPNEMQKYIKTHTYIEAMDMELFRKKLLFSMPTIPLNNIQTERILEPRNVPRLFHRFYKYDASNV